MLRTTPIGTILAWARTPNQKTVPNGWRICNGEEKTPNLEGKFLIGVKYAGETGKFGGTEIIPSDGKHNHSGNTGVPPLKEEKRKKWSRWYP